MSNARKFGLDISKFVAKAKSNMDAVTRKVVIDVGTSLVMKTPVGDASYWKSPPPKGYVGGRARSSWQYGRSAIPLTLLGDIDPTGAAAIRKIVAMIPPNAGGTVHVLVNHLPYINRLEDGWSHQAPNGMVALTVTEWQQIVRNAVNQVKK